MSKTSALKDHLGGLNPCGNQEVFSGNFIPSDINIGKEVATEVVKNIFENVINRKDIHLEGSNNVTSQNPKCTIKLKTTEVGDALSLNNPFENDLCQERKYYEVPIVKNMKDNELSIDKQLESLIEDLQDINFELEHNCKIDVDISQFLEEQGEFTKEILDAYLTSSELSKENEETELIKPCIEQTRANHDIQNFHPQDFIVRDEVLEQYLDEKILNVTNLDWAVPENVPLPDDSDEEFKEENKHLFQTVAEIHATLVGDQRNIVACESSSLPMIKDAGEYKIGMIQPEVELSQKVDDQSNKEKKKASLKSRLWRLFAKSPSVSSRTSRFQ